jgi:sodium transport system permease protein
MKLFIIVQKELIDQIRDKRTMIAAVFMPAVIVPLLLFFMTQTTADDKLETPIRIVLREAAPQLQATIQETLRGTSFLYASSLEESIKNGEAELGIDIDEEDGPNSSLTLRYDSSRRVSSLAYAKIHGLLAAMFAKPATATATDEVRIRSAAIRSEKESETMLTLSVLLPVFLIIFAASSTMSSVIDLSAGEKERGTIETLISCNISRRDILLGKSLAAAGIGFTAVLSLLLGLTTGSQVSPRMTGGLSLLDAFGASNIVLMLLVAFMSVLFFSAGGMAIGLYAKSVKEGTILTLPVIILCSALSSGFIGGDPFSIDLYYYFIPILNLVCVIRSLIFAHVDALSFMISILANLAYTSLMLLLGNYLLKKETVISRS